jgi:hypothetical protein
MSNSRWGDQGQKRVLTGGERRRLRYMMNHCGGNVNG